MKSDRLTKTRPRNSLATWFVHGLVRLLVASLYRLSQVARFLTRYRVIDPDRGAEVLLTGTFHSEAWIMAFIKPMAMAHTCRNVVLVTTFPVPDTDGVTVICPAAALRRVIGDVPARRALRSIERPLLPPLRRHRNAVSFAAAYVRPLDRRA